MCKHLTSYKRGRGREGGRERERERESERERQREIYPGRMRERDLLGV